MAVYCIAGQEIYFSCPVSELKPFAVAGKMGEEIAFSSDLSFILSNQAVGFVGGETRTVQVWKGDSGTLLKVDGGGDVCILTGGRQIIRVDDASKMTALDREILAGPALVLALAQNSRTWCLHASAAMFRNSLMVFLGESGRGKSTLAAYLSDAGGEWLRVVDDILPVTAHSSGVEAWPRFPQLKMPGASCLAPRLPESIPVGRICLLADVEETRVPELQLISHVKAAQILIGHTAGARLFDPRLLADHLAFASEAARFVPIYALAYPRRWDALAGVKGLLEALC